MSSIDRFRLDGRIAAVIGAASGIGEAVAVASARQGAAVVCLDVNEAGAQATARTIRGQGTLAESGPLDIRRASDVDRTFDQVRARHGRLDIVICTPSINVRKPLSAYTEEEFDRVVELNLKGSFNVLRAAGRIMTEQRGGSIVLFASIRAQVVEPGQGVYAATKAGLVQLVRTAAAELGSAGVRVNAVGPGIVETPLTSQIKDNSEWYRAYAAKTVLGRWAQPDEMVGPTVFLASDAASYVTGSLLIADGGWTAADGRFVPPGM